MSWGRPYAEHLIRVGISPEVGAPEERRDGRGRGSAKRKLAAVLRLLRGEDLETLSRELGVTAATCPAGGISFWRAAQRT